MPYCETCGSQVSQNAKFCGNCGSARTQFTTANPQNPPTKPKRERLSYYSPPVNAFVPSAPLPIMQTPIFQTQSPVNQPYSPQTQSATQPIQMPMPRVTGETTTGVIVFRKPKSMGRWDTYTGVVTTHRLIFAQMTSKMISDAAQQSREQAKAQGKGFFGQWADQLRATFSYSQRYLTMAPQAIISETPGNFALDNNTISKINVHLKGAHDGDNQRREFEVKFHSNSGTYVFRMDENSEFTDTLKRVYDQRVEMPFGYFSKSINIKI